MAETVLQLDPRDNVLVALTPLAAGTVVHYGHAPARMHARSRRPIPAKHKMALADLNPGDLVRMYGMVVGEVTQAIPRGGLLSTRNVRHRADPYTATRHPVSFALPDASAWLGRTFMGYHRADGQVGTRNYWLVLPLVFCENRNVDRMREALEEELGYGSAHNSYRQYVRRLVHQRTSGNGAGTDDAGASGTIGARFPQSRRHSLSHPPGRLRRHAPGCAGALRLAGRVHSSPQRGRRDGAEPGLPERAGQHADGRAARARSGNEQAGAGLRSAEVRPRDRADEPRAR